MDDFIDELKERRSVRKYKSEMVPKGIIETICEAGTYAPSGMNRQATKIIAVTSQELRDKLSAINASIMKTDKDPFYGAPVVLVVLAEKSVATSVYDGALVMGNLMLAAHSLGIGSCWIHRAKETFETDEGKEILKSLGIEGEWEGIGNCILGFMEGEEPAVPPRKEGRIIFA